MMEAMIVRIQKNKGRHILREKDFVWINSIKDIYCKHTPANPSNLFQGRKHKADGLLEFRLL